MVADEQRARAREVWIDASEHAVLGGFYLDQQCFFGGKGIKSSLIYCKKFDCCLVSAE